ncbi:MAG: metallophosphoesterase [Propionibacteriaceae bacterium]
MSRLATSTSLRPLLAVFARRSAALSTRRALIHRVARSLLLTVVVALLALPFALAWGLGHAQIEDYLGPHRATFASNYRGEVQIDLGPFGNAYLPSPMGPVGLQITVGGVGAVDSGSTSFFSEQTLAAYVGIYQEPDEAIAGVVEPLTDDIVVESAKAELVLLSLFALVVMRRQLLAPWLVRSISRRRAVVVYLTAAALVFGSILAPRPVVQGIRVPVAVNLGPSLYGLTVDSLLLADLLDRGIKGVTLLTDRQQKAVSDYITAADQSLSGQYARLPSPERGETMLLGFSDLHCNQAMTELIRRMVVLTQPAQVLSSGDDTVNGTAAERFCITREARIADQIPFVDASGNHDSDVTESQMRNAKMTVLDGSVISSGGLNLVGDDDPERQVPFSIQRVTDRPETEAQLGQRMVDVARGKDVDVLLVHQPAASVVVMTTPDPPARLVLWGHFHSQAGPTVVPHADGSWTVGMQQGTAGGVRQPTITSFSTPFSPPLISADTYFYFRDDDTGLITGVQPVHFLPNATVVIDPRIKTGDLAQLPPETRLRLGSTATPTPSPSR